MVFDFSTQFWFFPAPGPRKSELSCRPMGPTFSRSRKNVDPVLSMFRGRRKTENHQQLTPGWPPKKLWKSRKTDLKYMASAFRCAAAKPQRNPTRRGDAVAPDLHLYTVPGLLLLADGCLDAGASCQLPGQMDAGPLPAAPDSFKGHSVSRIGCLARAIRYWLPDRFPAGRYFSWILKHIGSWCRNRKRSRSQCFHNFLLGPLFYRLPAFRPLVPARPGRTPSNFHKLS